MRLKKEQHKRKLRKKLHEMRARSIMMNKNKFNALHRRRQGARKAGGGCGCSRG